MNLAEQWNEECKRLNEANPNRIKDSGPLICADRGPRVLNPHIWHDASGKPIEVDNPCILPPGHEGEHKYVGMNR